MTLEPKSILSPFCRDRQRDFASGSGSTLLKSKVMQALSTEGATPQSSGELLWRTEFGSGLHLLRHRRNDDILAELARVYVRDTLARWVPEAELLETKIVSNGNQLILEVKFREARNGASRETSTSVVLYDSPEVP